MLSISAESPRGADLGLLMARHTADMHADTPAESIHMMDAAALDHADIAFYVLRDVGVPVAMGALKRIDDDHAEVKSMHVLAERRGGGFSRLMLDHLMAEAKAAGYRRLSLETGAQAMFLPARRLYERAGFAECAPFADYVPDPNSVFMARAF